jgi:hypothetical protein
MSMSHISLIAVREMFAEGGFERTVLAHANIAIADHTAWGEMSSESTSCGDWTVRAFSEGLGWLIINSRVGGVPVEDQIPVLQCALDALRRAFPR